MRRVLRERFVKTAELSLFALTTGMPRRDAARIFYQVCGALPALAYPFMRHPTRFCVQPLCILWEPLSTPRFVLRCALCPTLPQPCLYLDKAMPGCLPAFQGREFALPITLT